MRPIPWLSVLVACSAAPGADDDACLPGADPTLTIGLGIEAYSEIPNGGDFPLVHGPQGGFHLEIGLAAAHLDASDLMTGHLTGTIDGQVYAETAPWLDFRCELAEDPALTSWGTRLVYDATPDFLDGKVTTVTAEVTDASGTTVETTSTFTIRDDGR